MKTYEYLARMLNDYGTTHFFFQDVINRMVSKEGYEKYGIVSVMAHSEVSAGYMADGYARAGRKVGMCGGQSIGAANLAAGLGDAYLGCVPVIGITGKKDIDHQYVNAYQELDHDKMFSGVTKWQADAYMPGSFPRLLRMAYKEATTGKPRPVHLDIYSLAGWDEEMVEITDPYVAEPQYGKLCSQRPQADPDAVKEAATWIDLAKKPILVLGRGANYSEAGANAKKLMEKAEIPVCTTPDGKTLVDEKHALWAGIAGGYGMSCTNKALAEADLVIFVGTQASDQTTFEWLAPPRTTKVIQIDICGSEVGKNYPKSVGLVGDARAVLGQLAKAVEPAKHTDWVKKVKGYLADFEARAQAPAAREELTTERLLMELDGALPNNAMVVADTGYSAVWSATMLRMKPSQDYIRAAGSLGWSYPASIGAKCALPDRPVICFTGDGGFYYYMGEMETAVRHNIPVVIVMNNNCVLSQCVPTMEMQYGAQQAEEGIDKITFGDFPFAEVAAKFGLHAVRVTRAQDIKPAIKKAIASGKPAMVEVMTVPGSHPLPAME